MIITVKDKHTLIFDEFKFKCCVGKNGFSKNKLEGDKKTPTENMLWALCILEGIEKKFHKRD